MTPLVLSVLALIFSMLLPVALSTPRFHFTPGAAIFAWQATACGAVLAALGAGLSAATQIGWPTDLAQWLEQVLVLGLTAVVGLRLATSGHHIGRAWRRSRQRQREWLEVLSETSPHDERLRVLHHSAPAAYCLPGVHRSVIVVTDSALEALSPEETDALLAHERAHVAARHDVVLELFSVLSRAFPRAVASGRALGQVRLLIEILADRRAARHTSPRAVLGALVVVAQGPTPPGAMGIAGTDLARRAEVLRDKHRRPWQTLGLVAFGLAVLVIPTWWVVWPWWLSVS